jgi:hypothetical protein
MASLFWFPVHFFKKPERDIAVEAQGSSLFLSDFNHTEFSQQFLGETSNIKFNKYRNIG